MRKSRSRVLLVELIVLSFLASALGVSVLAGDEYQVTATIESPEQQSNSFFGFPVDVYGDIMVIGESWASVEGKYRAGRAHIFDLDGNLKETFQAPSPEISGQFGRRMAIRGDIILVGERGATVDDLSDAGRAYIYNSDGSLHATMQSPTPTMDGGFGYSLCFSGDTIVVGEPNADIEGISAAGKVHLYDSDGNFLETLQSPEPFAASYFGDPLDGSEGIFVAGEIYAKVGDTRQAGKAYIFDSDGDLLATLQSPEPQYDAGFSNWVAVSGDIVVVGEYWAEVDGHSKAGRAHIFDTDGNLLASLQSPEPEANAMFGTVVDTSGDLILVGEPSANGEGMAEGRVYVFDSEGNLLATLSASEPAPRTEFGSLVYVKGETIIVGEYGADKEGKLYVFQPGAAPSPSPSPTPKPGGIPGFPVESLIAGLAVAVLVLWFLQRTG